MGKSLPCVTLLRVGEGSKEQSFEPGPPVAEPPPCGIGCPSTSLGGYDPPLGGVRPLPPARCTKVAASPKSTIEKSAR